MTSDAASVVLAAETPAGAQLEQVFFEKDHLYKREGLYNFVFYRRVKGA